MICWCNVAIVVCVAHFYYLLNILLCKENLVLSFKFLLKKAIFEIINLSHRRLTQSVFELNDHLRRSTLFSKSKSIWSFCLKMAPI